MRQPLLVRFGATHRDGGGLGLGAVADSRLVGGGGECGGRRGRNAGGGGIVIVVMGGRQGGGIGGAGLGGLVVMVVMVGDVALVGAPIGGLALHAG